MSLLVGKETEKMQVKHFKFHILYFLLFLNYENLNRLGLSSFCINA
jgi:hypothetical protein